MGTSLPPEVAERTRAGYWYRRANIPENLQSIDWERFDGTALEAVAGVAFELADAWVNEGGYRGIALFGMPGRGKTTLVATMLCALIRATIPTTISGLFSDDVEGYFITLSDYHRLYLRSYELDRWASRSHGEAGEAYAEWEKNYALRRFIEEEVPHLVLDDVGNEHQTASGAVQDEFHTLIRGRYGRGLSTSITSNLNREEFAATYGGPQLSFIHEATEVAFVKGEDFRSRLGRD